MALTQDISAYIFYLLICDHHCPWLPTLFYVCSYTFTSAASSPLGISFLILVVLWVERFCEDLLSVFLSDDVVFFWFPWIFTAVHAAFSSWGKWGLLCCYGAWAPGARASVVVAHGFQSSGSAVVVHGLALGVIWGLPMDHSPPGYSVHVIL